MNHTDRFHKYLLLPLTIILMFGVLGSDCKKNPAGPDTKPNTMKGNDGKVYQTVTIGNQVWMAENLRETKYRNRDAIPNVTDNSTWFDLRTGARCAYNNDANNESDTYGYLYNWFAAVDARNIAPEGWRVPSDEDWTALTNYLIANGYNWDGTTEGNKIGKAMASSGGEWQSHGTAGNVGNDPASNNASGFSALPGGYRSSYGSFGGLGLSAVFWSATEYYTNSAWYRRLYYNTSYVGRNANYKQYGFSVRLVRD